MCCGRVPCLTVAVSQEPVVGGLACHSESVDEVCLPRAPLDRYGQGIVGELGASIRIPEQTYALGASAIGEVVAGHERNYAYQRPCEIPRTAARCREIPVDKDPALTASVDQIPWRQVVVADDLLRPTWISAAARVGSSKL